MAETDRREDYKSVNERPVDDISLGRFELLGVY